MSFNVEIRKVRDPARPYGARVIALAHCLEIYSPIGFQASWAYLEAKVGAIRSRDERVLLAAADLVESSRQTYLEELRAYAALRRRHKATRGQRSPHSAERTPFRPARWHAAPVEAACFVLRWRTRPGGRAVRDVEAGEFDPGSGIRRLTDEFLRAGSLTPGQLAELRTLSAALRPWFTREAYQADPRAYHDTHQVRRLADHLSVAAGDH